MPDHRHVPTGDKSVDELAELLIVMRRQTQATSAALSRVDHHRINLLFIHAVAAILIGVLFAFSEPTLVGPVWKYLKMIPGFPYSFAAVMTIGGLILLPGALARKKILEIWGLGLIYAWYFGVALGFFLPGVFWVSEAIAAHFANEPLPGDRPSFYAWVVYLHLAIIMRVHIWTLWKVHRSQKDVMGRLTSKPPPPPEGAA